MAVAALVAGVGPIGSAQAQPYQPAGRPITGGENAGAAVALPPGEFIDTLDRGSADYGTDGSVRYYAIALNKGDTPYFAATLAAPTSGTDGRTSLSITLTARGSTSSCGSASASGSDVGAGVPAITAVAAPDATGSERGCPAGTVVVALTRAGDAAVDDALDVDIAFRVEPSASTSGLPPAATKRDNVDPDLVGTPTDLVSGHSYARAPVLGSGIYRDTLELGDVRIVAIHLDWGQRFSYAVTASRQPGLENDVLPRVTSQIRNPLRQEVRQADGSTTSAYSFGGSDGGLAGSTPAPVRFANRSSDDSAVVTCAAAGDYFLMLSADIPEAASGSESFPYSLQVRVFGSVSGAPAYRVDGAPPTTSGTSTAARATDGGSGGSTTLVLIGVGAATGILLVTGLMLVHSRRGRREVSDGATRRLPTS